MKIQETNDLSDEIIDDLRLSKDNPNDGILLLFTRNVHSKGEKPYEGGIRTAIYNQNTEQVVRMILHNTLNSGDLQSGLDVCNMLISIGETAKHNIEHYLQKRSKNN